MRNMATRLHALLTSRWFFWGVIVFFVLEALWFVFFMAYPLAFDENTHFWVIQAYATQWHPFFQGHPPAAAGTGLLARDPSYLYYYLMSFPYRLVALVTGNLAAQVIVLRLLNVALFTGGLLLFRKVLRRAGTSRALTNTALAIFVLVPIVPYLAAHINYDNLVFLLLPALLLLAFRLHESLRERRVDVTTWLLFFIGCLVISTVKFAAAVLVLPVFGFLVYAASRSFRGRGRELITSTHTHFKKLSGWAKIALLAGLVIAFGLFFQRAGVNLFTYGELKPRCNTVLSLEQCLQFGPFARDYENRQESGGFDPNPVIYMGEWLWGMWHRSFFAVSGELNDFANKPGLPVPKFTAIALLIFGLLAVLARFRSTFRQRPFLQMLAVMAVFYVAILWLKLFSGTYSDTGDPVAINGRYLIPILLPMAAVMGRGISVWLKKRPNIKPLLASAAILLFLYGGGVFTYIIRSEPAWLWQNEIVLQVNEAARNALSPLILH